MMQQAHRLKHVLMGGLFCLVVGLLPSAQGSDNTCAGEWEKLDAEKITEALSSRTLTYSSTISQKFYASGRTLYETGTPSWGFWRVQGDQYCSQWPPQNSWTCYDLYLSKNGVSLKFEGSHNNVSVGGYKKSN